MAENDSLSAKQLQFVAELAQGKTILAACDGCQVSESTAHRWLKQAAIKDAIEQAQQSAFEDKLKALRTGVGAALSALARQMDSKAPPALQVRSAEIWLRTAVELHKAEKLEARIAELEQIIRDKLA